MAAVQLSLWDPRHRHSRPRRDAVTEVNLLLADDQVEALQAAAESDGVTTGTLIRRILRTYLLNHAGGIS